MDEEAMVRRAVLDAIDDVEPVGLQERIDYHLDHGSMVPGVLTVLTTDVLADGTTGSVVPGIESFPETAIERGIGVQLIYDGLRLTRQLARDQPWTGGEKETGDLDVLAADVLVARGFYLLARTEAADAAVGTVRAFGRDQTVWRETDDPSLDDNLEADVLELAVIAGAACGGVAAPPRLREFAVDMVGTVESGGFPEPDVFFSEGIHERLAAIATDTQGGEGVTTSVDD